MEQLKNIHPGEILKEEFLIPMNLSASKLAKEIGVHPSTISKIINGSNSISIETAIRLSQYFGNSVVFWMKLQYEFNMRKNQHITGTYSLEATLHELSSVANIRRLNSSIAQLKSSKRRRPNH